MILSDRTIKEQLAAGRIGIEPMGENAVQPSSVDLRIDRHFRVFRNHTLGLIDVKSNLEDLTELLRSPKTRPLSCTQENLSWAPP